MSARCWLARDPDDTRPTRQRIREWVRWRTGHHLSWPLWHIARLARGWHDRLYTWGERP